MDSDIEAFQSAFSQRVRERFEREHAEVEIYQGEISFELPLSRMPLSPFYIQALPRRGKITLHPQGTITYYLEFNDGLLLPVALISLLCTVFLLASNVSLGAGASILSGLFVFCFALAVIRASTGITRFRRVVTQIQRGLG